MNRVNPARAALQNGRLQRRISMPKRAPGLQTPTQKFTEEVES